LTSPLDRLTAFGLFGVTAMLVCYALEERSPCFVLAFAGALRAGLPIWIHAGRLAVRTGRGGVVFRRAAALVAAAQRRDCM